MGQGNKQGTATVTLKNDLGDNPGASYTVTGDFGGDIPESGKIAVTDNNGVASFTTTGTARGGRAVKFSSAWQFKFPSWTGVVDRLPCDKSPYLSVFWRFQSTTP